MSDKPELPMDMQAAFAITALAAALCKQHNINGEQLRLDFLEALEGLGGSPAAVGKVGQMTAVLMDSYLRNDRKSSKPPIRIS